MSYYRTTLAQVDSLQFKADSAMQFLAPIGGAARNTVMNIARAIAPAKPLITAAERARRIEAINFARGSVALEGGKLSAEVERLNARFIEGEIDSAEHTAAIIALN